MTEVCEEWVGVVEVGGRARTVDLHVAPSGAAPVTLDFPDELVFGLDVVLISPRPGELRAEISLNDQLIRLEGRSDGDLFMGTTGSGRFELRRVTDWDLAPYRALCGSHVIENGRAISLHVNPDLGAPIFFYAEGRRAVRIYPDVFGNLVSEAGELFTLAADGSAIESVRQLPLADDAPRLAVTSRPAWREEELAISGPDGVLAGTLMSPLGPGPHPAVVMIHGAAGGYRDFYRFFAEHFVRAGVAALVYDRRGHGASTGGPNPSFEEKSYDAEAWVDHLQSRDDIRSDRVGVWGFSNGTWVAPMIAARRPDVAFVAGIGATGTTALETEIHRRTFDLREQGVPEDQIEAIAEMWRIVYDLLDTRRPDAVAERRFDELAARVRNSAELAAIRLHEYAVRMPFLGPVPPYAAYEDIVADLPNHRPDSDEWRTDPVDSYRAVDVPVLFLVGEHDSNLPALVSARRVSRTLDEAGNGAATVFVLPEAGHAMNVVHLGQARGMTSEEAGYRLHSFRFAGGFLETVTSWAAARTMD